MSCSLHFRTQEGKITILLALTCRCSGIWSDSVRSSIQYYKYCTQSNPNFSVKVLSIYWLSLIKYCPKTINLQSTHIVLPYSTTNLLKYVALFAVAQRLRCCVTNRKVAVSIPAGVSGFFIDIKYFRSHYGPGFDSVPGIFAGVKAAGA